MNLPEIKAQTGAVGLRLLAVGAAAPGQPVTNDQLAMRVDTSDEWIVSRTGIGARHFCTDESNLDLAAAAAQQAMARAQISPQEIGVVIVATFTPDQLSPSMACGLRTRLGLAQDVTVFDLNAACAGFLYGLHTARQLLLADSRPYALVVGSEAVSRVLDFDDRSTCVLFGDGAGAAVLQLTTDRPFYWLGGSRADDEGWLGCSGLLAGRRPAVYMHGQEVFRFAVEVIPQCIGQLLQQACLTLSDIDFVVCHQANRRIINHVVKRLKARPEQFFVNLDKYGNTSSASIPLALNEMWEKGLLKPGMRIVCVGFGAGFTWSACLLEW